MKNSSVFDGMNVEEDLANGTYRYLLSLGNDKKEADKLKLKLQIWKFCRSIYCSIL